jgi:uncharacterized cupredoxin-like copper-binding protein
MTSDAGDTEDSYTIHINRSQVSPPSEAQVTDARTRRPPRPFRRASPWLLAGLLLTTIGLPSVAALASLPQAPLVGYARPVASTSVMDVNLTDAPAFSPRFLNVAAGSTVDLRLDNVGQFNHTFTLAGAPNVQLAPTSSPAQVYRFFQQHGVRANVSLAPGNQGWANLTFNASSGLSSFEFASVVPYQFQAGMWGLLNITSVGPGLLLSDNTTDTLQFVPSVLAASPAHYPTALDVLVTNEGSFGHTFSMAAQSNVTLSPTNFTQYFAQHPPLVSVNIPTGAGTTVWANFSVPGPGIYQYICEVPGHLASGMSGLLYVGVPVPAPPAAPSAAVVEAWVLAGSAILLGIGVVLAAVASFTGRFPRAPGSHGGHH